MRVRHAYVHPDDVVHDVDDSHRLLEAGETATDAKTARVITGPQRLIIAGEHQGPCGPGCAALSDALGDTVRRRAWLEAHPDAAIER